MADKPYELRRPDDGTVAFRFFRPSVVRDSRQLGLESSRPRILALDTNVVRGSSKVPGEGRYTLAELEAVDALGIPGDVIVELCTKIDSAEDFVARRAAARKLMNVTPYIFPQSSVYLRWLFGYVSTEKMVTDVDCWAHNLTYFAGMETFDEWLSDSNFQTLTQQRVDGYKAWREEHADAFKMTAKISRAKEHDDLSGKPSTDREAAINSGSFLEENLKALEERFTNGDATLVTAIGREFARAQLATYALLIHAYQQEVFLDDGGTVEENDRGDLDIMAFASSASPLNGGGAIHVVTGEPDWVRLMGGVSSDKLALSPLNILEQQ